MDPQAAMLRSQLLPFFPTKEEGPIPYAEIDEEQEGNKTKANGEAGQQKRLAARGGVWVRKPRSSRKGSGGEPIAQF